MNVECKPGILPFGPTLRLRLLIRMTSVLTYTYLYGARYTLTNDHATF